MLRITNNKIIAQVIEFNTKGDTTLAAVDSSALKKLGWNYSLKNTPSAYLTGLLIAKKTLDKKCNEVILDTGFKTPLVKGKIYAFLKGAIDGGLKIPISKEDIYPSEDRITGKHIKNAEPEKISELFNQIKEKIMG